MFFDLYQFLNHGNYHWDEATLTGSIEYPGMRIQFPESKVTGVYSRIIFPYQEHEIDEVRFSRLQRLKVMELILRNIPIMVINRPGSDLSNSSKFLHLYLLKECGFNVPETLLTNSAQDAEKFTSDSETIFKGASSEKTIVSKYNNALKPNLQLLKQSPVIFQKYISGADIRTHLLRETFFSERIDCTGVDYRYEKGGSKFTPVDIPRSIKELCIEYRNRSGLEFIGFDFKLLNNNEYIILEANPMPGYDGYDRRANMGISKALLNYLSSPLE
ncbi:hypothetical protein MKZ15_01260 [Paenibacillus sp. FSL R7-0216]|uniref:ATP-grasp domain-containing protein n=1 Tax=Paenibacillus sp. FSL R7-0216 TaxID=2921677 RepID=UPI0030DDBC23